MKHTSVVKNTEIKVRINEKDKIQLQESARKQKMTLSNYILMKCFTDTDCHIKMIPDSVRIWDTCNRIIHAVESTHDKNLLTEVENIIKHGLQKS